MADFADMEHIVYNYEDENIQFITTFENLADLDTSSVAGYMILTCDKGRIEVDVNGIRQSLKTYEALILPPHTRLSNHMGSPDVRCNLAIISADVVKRLLGGHAEEWDRCLYINKNNHIITNEEDREQFAVYVRILSFKLQQRNRRYHKEVLESLLRGVLFDYLEMMMAALPEMDHTATKEGQQKVLFRRFLELLSSRHVKHQLVDTYAQELCVSPNYLTKVCRKVTGKTALQWVREYTEADVRYYLLNTGRSVKEICYDLGFPNLSFFGKFCRRAFGMSPTEFRKKMKHS